MSRKADQNVPGAVGGKPAAPGKSLDPEDTSLKRPTKGTEPRAPHERDEAPDPLDVSHAEPVGGPRQVIEQAASDVSRGLVDTDRRGVPSDVPAPPSAPAPEDSPGAEMPQGEGLDRKSLAKRGGKRGAPRGGKDATHT